MSAPTTPTNPDGLTFEQAWAEIVAQNREALVAMIREVFREAEDERLRQAAGQMAVTQNADAVRKAGSKARRLLKQIHALAAEATALDAELSETRKAAVGGYPLFGATATWAGTGIQGADGALPFTFLTHNGGKITLRLQPQAVVSVFETMLELLQDGDPVFGAASLAYVRRAVASWPVQSDNSAMSGSPVRPVNPGASTAAAAAAESGSG